MVFYSRDKSQVCPYLMMNQSADVYRKGDGLLPANHLTWLARRTEGVCLSAGFLNLKTCMKKSVIVGMLRVCCTVL